MDCSLGLFHAWLLCMGPLRTEPADMSWSLGTEESILGREWCECSFPRRSLTHWCSMLGNHLRALRLGRWPIALEHSLPSVRLPHFEGRGRLAPPAFSLSCLCLAFSPSGPSSFNPGRCPQAGWVHLPLHVLGEGKLVLIPFPCLHSAPSLPTTAPLRASLLEPSTPLPRGPVLHLPSANSLTSDQMEHSRRPINSLIH